MLTQEASLEPLAFALGREYFGLVPADEMKMEGGMKP